jgi:hypothetical protein
VVHGFSSLAVDDAELAIRVVRLDDQREQVLLRARDGSPPRRDPCGSLRY